MLVSTIVDMKAVDSTKDSQRLWLQVLDSSEDGWTAALVASGRLFGRELTAALDASGRLFGRESSSGSEVVGSSEERTTATWVRGVVDSSEESRQRFLSTNPTVADTSRPSSMLNIDS